jgi:site-specific DNA recombinase
LSFYGTGQYNLEGLTDEMFRLGLRNRRGGKVSLNGFSVILNNPFYIGLIRLRRTGETFPGSHQPLIPKSLYDRVQRILSGKTNTRTQRHDFTFRRLLACKSCSYSLIGETHKGFIYYRCQTRTCPKTCIREELIDSKVLEIFEPLDFSEEEKLYFQQKMAGLRAQWTNEREDYVQELTMRLGQIQERLARLTDAYIDRVLEKEIFEERKTALLIERRDLEEKLTQIKSGADSVPDRLAEFLELAGSAYLSYKMGFLKEKRDLLKTVTSNREVMEKI